MRAVVGLLLSLAGCDYVLGLDRLPGDASMDGAGPCLGKFGDLGAGLLQVCLDRVPTAPIDIPSQIDTSTGCDQIVRQSDQTEVCVFAGTTIGLSTAIVATGTRPLVLVATDAIAIAAGGSLDASSRSIGNEIGAGGQNRCDATQNGESNNNGGAGGAGGSFGDLGGPGGHAENGAVIEAAGGDAPGVVTLTGVRGGCGGGRGGDGIDAGGGGGAGAGGGAVYLIAGTSIQVAGTILASGGAGLGGSGAASGGGTSGGGGGGSGGLIGLDAPVIEILASARLVANGAGGGGGGGKEAGADGSMGEEPNIAGSFPYIAAGGKAADGSISGAGGGGGAWSIPAGVQGMSSDEAGGGGGGGVGYILVYAPDRTIETTTITPTLGP